MDFNQDGQVTHLRLTDPELDFWVDVRLRRISGTWLAVADLAGSPEPGVSANLGLALLLALWPLGPDAATRIARRVDGSL